MEVLEQVFEAAKAGIHTRSFVLQQYPETLFDLVRVSLQKFTLKLQTQALELYGKQNQISVQCFIMLLVLEACYRNKSQNVPDTYKLSALNIKKWNIL